MDSTPPKTIQPLIDRISVVTFISLSVWQTYRLFIFLSGGNKVAVVIAFVLSALLADFMSGLVHWAADTWGTAKWPIVGPALIGPFREHHVDKTAITHHDFYETNGNNCLVSLPILISLFFISHLEATLPSFIFTLFLGLTTWIFMTNQFHKWSHQEKIAPVIDLAQRLHFILPKAHHEFHHQYPFTKNYCITTGWMNPILNKIQFFSKLELLITKLTGAQPREDDLSSPAIETSLKHS